ncbi:MAG: hypothetical protein MHMPM18_002817, partial [Marteilia pararefringens]
TIQMHYSTTNDAFLKLSAINIEGCTASVTIPSEFVSFTSSTLHDAQQSFVLNLNVDSFTDSLQMSIISSQSPSNPIWSGRSDRTAVDNSSFTTNDNRSGRDCDNNLENIDPRMTIDPPGCDNNLSRTDLFYDSQRKALSLISQSPGCYLKCDIMQSACGTGNSAESPSEHDKTLASSFFQYNGRNSLLKYSGSDIVVEMFATNVLLRELLALQDLSLLKPIVTLIFDKRKQLLMLQCDGNYGVDAQVSIPFTSLAIEDLQLNMGENQESFESTYKLSHLKPVIRSIANESGSKVHMRISNNKTMAVKIMKNFTLRPSSNTVCVFIEYFIVSEY